MKEFYGKQLDLGVRSDRPDRFTFDAGETRMTFVESATTGSERAFYHFAFNIPENRILAALEWQKARTPLLPIPERNRDPELPADVDFSAIGTRTRSSSRSGRQPRRVHRAS